MNTIRILYILLFIISAIACNLTNEEKLTKILNADEFYIQLNTYGGLAGYAEQEIYIKNDQNASLLIINEGTDYQTYILMDEKLDLLNSFIEEAYRTNQSDRKMAVSCIGGPTFEFILKSGYTSLSLRPSEKADSIFSLILDHK